MDFDNLMAPTTNNEDDDDDAELLAELLALENDSQPQPIKKPIMKNSTTITTKAMTKKQPSSVTTTTTRQIQIPSLDNIENISDEDIMDDDLLDELAQIMGGSSNQHDEPKIQNEKIQEKSTLNELPTIPAKDYSNPQQNLLQSPKNDLLLETLMESLNFYKAENNNSIKAQDLPKSRRCQRTIGKINDLLRKVEAGKIIDPTEIPPYPKNSPIQTKTDIQNENPTKDLILLSTTTNNSNNNNNNFSLPEPIFNSSELIPDDSVKKKMEISDDPFKKKMEYPAVVVVEPIKMEISTVERENSSIIEEPIVEVMKMPPNNNNNNDDNEKNSTTIAKKAEQLLRRRRKLYWQNANMAKEAGDLKNAGESLAIVKLFDSAIDAIQNGVVLSEDDITEIPPTPPPYKKAIVPTTLMEELQQRLAKYQEFVKQNKEAGEDARARMNGRFINQYLDAIKRLKRGEKINVVGLPVPPGFVALTENSYDSSSSLSSAIPASTTTSSKQTPFVVDDLLVKPKLNPTIKNDKYFDKFPSSNTTIQQQQQTHYNNMEQQESILRNLITKQVLLKKEAISAKNRGDLFLAKEFLTKSKLLDEKIQNFQRNIPGTSSNSSIPITTAAAKNNFPLQTQKDKELKMKLEKELINQIKICDECAKQFQKLNDTKAVTFYTQLLQSTEADFKRLKVSIQIPKFKLLDLSLPALDVTDGKIPENILELRIIKIEKLKLPDGWSGNDCAIYVTYNFPFPHEAHQIGRTNTIKGTINPEFLDVYQLNINRKSRQLLRILKRVPLKLEIYQKGSFLRSDKLWGHVEVSLVELETKAIIEKTYDILEGRRKTGGTINVSIKCGRALSSTSTTATTTISRKWVRLL